MDSRDYKVLHEASKFGMKFVNDVSKNISLEKLKLVKEKDGFMHFVQITPLFRFHDDIFVKLFSEDGKTNVWLQSQSRLGLHDLMVNEKRIKHIYSKLKELT